MKTLYILRHAKSSWDDSGLSDHERPLNERGRKTAPFMGDLMRRRAIEPGIILSSPATRAEQTAHLVKAAAGWNCELRFDDRIYEASPQRLLEVVSGIDEGNPSALIVGHNPGIEGFIRYLTGTLEPMPTTALAILELDIKRWNEVGENCGTAVEIVRPKQLMS